MDKIKHLLGENIKHIRKRQNITQENLAELVDRSKNHISKIEQGLTNPPLDLLISISNALNVSLKDLFDFSKLNDNLSTEEITKNLSLISDNKQANLIYEIYKLIDKYN